MRKILQVFILFALFANVIFADQFRDSWKISLKKDEQKKFLVKYASYEKIFKLRWTLYSNEALVVFRSYDRHVSQNILYARAKNGSFRVELKTRGANYRNVAYMLVQFKAFDYEKNEAKFEIFLSDRDMEIEIQELNK